MRKLNVWVGMASVLFLAGCVSHASMPSEASTGEKNYRIDSPAELAVSTDLLNYTSDATSFVDEGDLTARAVRDAGRRLGATAGYRDQANVLYEHIAQFDEYWAQIFDFSELMLPSGIVSPVLAQTSNSIRYDYQNGAASKEIRAKVLKTVRDARFANPRAPSWRDYLMLDVPALDEPLSQLQAEIDRNRGVWKAGVREGYQRGTEQARQAFEIAINELSRDYLGMQLFRMLWLAGQVEPPKIVEQATNVVGGGRGSTEMSLGVRRFVISEPVYFVNDTSEWTALITSVLESNSAATAGLNDIVKRIDNTSTIPEATIEPNLKSGF